MAVKSPSVLMVDDDASFRMVMEHELSSAGLEIETLAAGELVENKLLRQPFDVVLLDLHMGQMDGVETLRRIKQVRPFTEVIILTGHGSVEAAVQTLKLGAYDFLAKPCDLDHLESVIRNAARAREMRSENFALRQEIHRHEGDRRLIGRSMEMKKLRALTERVAPSESTVLIRGESGCGKEVVAREIHRLSTKGDRPFVTLDCGAMDESLALSELFGHERGAYTGADTRKHGLFEMADSGTILVDEVGDAPLSLQSRLLRVLETGTFRHLGGEESIKVDVRILAATHRDLEARVKDGTFRQDLYYRLNVLTIEVASLRERLTDVPELVEHFLRLLCPGQIPDVEPETMSILQGYSWPGNVRELRNVVERAVILSDRESIRPEDLPSNLAQDTAPWENSDASGVQSLGDVELRYLRSLLKRFDGSRAKVAAALGISERTLYRKLHPHRESDD
jgi:DNA-binding NtrC family response regulator